ncbi:hypothetical protein C0V75_18055 [Tabrizicola sp. TH137]|uniref:hypothetical protein n=1 Tax=Tabrizicola sp. TH137 TaxID=2067452 RepID=UPI000C7A132A|nr:hypothetical protein [Tabrizicola sp. TH137]PLL11184.1 hypothetical protein C0V75_18055 [Tabrizicola sp. TH137]
MSLGGAGEEIGATDLFFSLAAVLIVLLCITSQALRGTLAAETEAEIGAQIGAAPVSLVLARAEEVVLRHGDGAPLRVPLDAVLAGVVEDWARGVDGQVWVIIAEDAADSAFLLDTALSRAGLAEMRRVRLAGPCARPRLVAGGVACGG